MDIPSRSKPAHEQAAEMAVLAQCKFNETRKNLQSLKSARSRGRKCGDDAPDQLLSTLLYLSTMLDKVEGMKQMLRSDSPSLYQEWKPLLDALHCPSAQLREQSNQTKRIQRLHKRRGYYKDEVAKSKVQSAQSTCRGESTAAILGEIARAEGMRGLYKGFLPGAARSFVANGVGMAVYSYTQSMRRD